MQKAIIPSNENERLEAVKRLGLLNREPEKRLDDLTSEAIVRLDIPMSTVTILENDREWFKSRQWVKSEGGDRATSFCGYALLADSLFIVEDTLKDEHFKDNPNVVGEPFIRFYAGMTLRDRETGLLVGVFCIKDTKPRNMNMMELDIFMNIAKKVEDEINRDKSN